MNLVARSVEVILAGQSPSGGYVACPNFEQYRYAWLRDGCFVADAMREAGEVQSCDRFLDWCGRIVMRSPGGPFDARYYQRTPSSLVPTSESSGTDFLKPI